MVKGIGSSFAEEQSDEESEDEDENELSSEASDSDRSFSDTESSSSSEDEGVSYSAIRPNPGNLIFRIRRRIPFHPVTPSNRTQTAARTEVYTPKRRLGR